jgi:hypothetical protein
MSTARTLATLAVALVTTASLTAAPAAADTEAVADGPHGCDPGQFCLYQNDNYTVMVARMSSCTWHDVRDKYFRSYVNGLRPLGTRARFYTATQNFITYTKPSPDKGTTSYGLSTGYVRPC